MELILKERKNIQKVQLNSNFVHTNMIEYKADQQRKWATFEPVSTYNNTLRRNYAKEVTSSAHIQHPWWNARYRSPEKSAGIPDELSKDILNLRILHGNELFTANT